MDNQDQAPATDAPAPRLPFRLGQSLFPSARRQASSFLTRCLQMTPLRMYKTSPSSSATSPTTTTSSSSTITGTGTGTDGHTGAVLYPPLTTLELQRVLTRRVLNMHLPDDAHTYVAEALHALIGVTTSLFAKLYVLNLPVVTTFLARYPFLQGILVLQLYPFKLLQAPLLRVVRPLQWLLAPFAAMAAPFALHLTVQRGLTHVLRTFPAVRHRLGLNLNNFDLDQNHNSNTNTNTDPDRARQRERTRQRIRDRKRDRRIATITSTQLQLVPHSPHYTLPQQVRYASTSTSTPTPTPLAPLLPAAREHPSSASASASVSNPPAAAITTTTTTATSSSVALTTPNPPGEDAQGSTAAPNDGATAADDTPAATDSAVEVDGSDTEHVKGLAVLALAQNGDSPAPVAGPGIYHKHDDEAQKALNGTTTTTTS